jgi:hypothetical protein
MLVVLGVDGLFPHAAGAYYRQNKIAEIPQESTWIDRGIVLSPGKPGSWDVRLGGMISPSTVVKKDGFYFLYYIGADGDRSTDGGPRHRALGVATSKDGIRFEKHGGNPIIKFLPNNNEEEGVFSAAATLDVEGNIVLYYGAMDAGSQHSTSVTSDVRLAVSRDGFQFTDMGIALSYRDKSVWGYGDELFPVGSFQSDGIWHVYYLAKSGMRRLLSYVTGMRPIYWDLGLAWGKSSQKLTNSKKVLASGSYIIGGGDPVALGEDRIALFIVRDFDNTNIEVRTASAQQPHEISAAVQVYRFRNLAHGTTFLDRDTSTWFLYYLDYSEAAIRVKTAPVHYSTSGSNRYAAGS